MSSFLTELRRRNVFKVAVAYAIVAWLLAQVASVFSPALRLPEWVPTLVALLLLLGFPIAMLLTWAYELTPDGVRRTAKVPFSASMRQLTGRRLDFAIIGLLVLALGFVAVDRYVLEAAREPASDADAETARSDSAHRERIAVLPFVSMSTDPEQAYFSEGISEELLNLLQKTPNLRVPSRTSSFSFKDGNTDLRTIAAQLGVDHVLEGSVQKAGNRVRIRAQLIDVATDTQLWTQTYERELTDVFAIQDEIAENVVLALQVELLGAPAERRSGERTESTEAHDAYLLGLHYLSRQRSEDIAKAREEFGHAIELDPGYAAAYTGLANAVLTAQRYGLMERAAAVAAAEPAIDQALRLDPRLAEAHFVRASLADDPEAALAGFQRAIELNPNFALAYFAQGFVLARLNRTPEAHVSLETALELDPLDPLFNWYMGNLRLSQRQIDESRIYYRRAIELEPAQPNSYAGLGDIEIATGHLDSALEDYLAGLEQDPGQPHITSIVGLIYHSLGDEETARRWFDSAAGMLQAGSMSRFFREFLPLVSRLEDPDGLLAVLRDVPPSQFGAYGSRLFRKAALSTGRIDEIRAFYERHWPELFADPPDVNPTNFDVGPDVAWLLEAEGESARAQRLANETLRIFRDPSQRTIAPPEWGLAMVEVEALASLGRGAEALAAMRRAVDGGWRMDWWQVERDPTLGSIRGEPMFAAMMSEVKADLAAQLERVHELEEGGALDPRPKR